MSVATLAQLKEREGIVVLAETEEIALFKIDGEIHALTNVCPHRGGPIGEGAVEAGLVTCPWHGWQFNVTTGAMPHNANVGLKRFPVRIDGEKVLVEI